MTGGPDEAGTDPDFLRLRPGARHDCFVASNLPGQSFPLFGGQIFAQGMMAARMSVGTDRRCSALGIHFLRPGRTDIGVGYEVERTRDGRAMSTRRVVATQEAASIAILTASFQSAASGPDRQFAVAPPMPDPAALTSERARYASLLAMAPDGYPACPLPQGVDARWVDPQQPPRLEVKPPGTRLWIRVELPIGDDEDRQQAMLAFVSDYVFLETALRAVGSSWTESRSRATSIDHKIWFHRAPDIRDWHIYDTDCPVVSDGRCLVRGQIFDGNGQLIASTAQEGTMRQD